MIHLQATGQHKNKAGLTHSPVYYPFASTHMVNTQLLHVPNVHTKCRKYFRGFLNSRLLSFARNSQKFMYREYYHIYSSFMIAAASKQEAEFGLLTEKAPILL